VNVARLERVPKAAHKKGRETQRRGRGREGARESGSEGERESGRERGCVRRWAHPLTPPDGSGGRSSLAHLKKEAAQRPHVRLRTARGPFKRPSGAQPEQHRLPVGGQMKFSNQQRTKDGAPKCSQINKEQRTKTSRGRRSARPGAGAGAGVAPCGCTGRWRRARATCSRVCQ